MPPRAITLGILGLWLAAVSWGAYRAWGRAPGPPALLDRTDEVGKQAGRWRVRQNGAEIGHVQTTVGRPARGALFALHANFSFGEELRLRGLPFKLLKSTYRVAPRGQLRQLKCEVVLGDRKALLEGRRDDDAFRATVRRDLPKACEQFESSGPVGVLDVLHPLHRMPGLYEGRQWSVLAIDPLEMALDIDGRGGWFSTMEATTRADHLLWADKSVPCWRVDFRGGDQVRARVWARRDDGLVLRQEAACGGGWFDVQREADHAPGGRAPGLKLPGMGQ